MPSITLLAIFCAAATVIQAANTESRAGNCLEANAVGTSAPQKVVAVDDQQPAWDSTPFDQAQTHENLKRDTVSIQTRDVSLPLDSNNPDEAEIIIILGQPGTVASFDTNFLEPEQNLDASEPRKRQVTTTSITSSPPISTSTITQASSTTTITQAPPIVAETTTSTQYFQGQTSTGSIIQASSTATETITSMPYPQGESSYRASQASVQRSSASYFRSLAIGDAVKHSQDNANYNSESVALSRSAANLRSSQSALSSRSRSAASAWSSASTWAASHEATASKSADNLESLAVKSKPSSTTRSNSAAVSRKIPLVMLTRSGIAAIILLGLAAVL